MTLEQGDAFEAEHRVWIRENLPHYETVWSEFIGHDGCGRPQPMLGLTAKQDSDRKKFYQSHYSLALSCFQIDATCKDVDLLIGTPDCVTKYLREISLLNSFVSHVGHVYDMIKDMAEALHHDPIRAPFHRFFGFRSHALHAARIPLQRDQFGLKLPRISWSEKQKGEWNDDTPWEKVDWSQAVYLTDLCREVRSDLFNSIMEIHPLIRSKAHDYFQRTIEEPVQNSSSITHAISAYTYFPQISGSANLS